MTNLRLQQIILLVGTLIGIAKFWAYFITHSNSIFSDALESLAHIVIGVFALYSIYLSSLPKDSNHPYGHGKVEFISSMIEGFLVLSSGVIILIKSIYSLYHPVEMHELHTGIVIVSIAGLMNYLMGALASKQGKRTNSPTLIATGVHLKSDGYTTVALIMGLVVMNITNLLWMDSVIAMIFCAIIIYQGVKILRESVAGIMDESDEVLINSIIESLHIHRKDAWIDIHNFRIIKYGPGIHIDAHLTLPWYYNGREIHSEVKELESLIDEIKKDKVEMFVHTDPCEEWSCRICQMKDCQVRKEKFERKIEWNLENIIRDEKHKIES